MSQLIEGHKGTSHLFMGNEAIHIMGLGDRVGILKLGTTWPLPRRLMEKYLTLTDWILLVEEVIPFLEEHVMVLAAELAPKIGVKKFFGKRDGSIPMIGELNPDLVVAALAKILGVEYEAAPEPYTKQAHEIASSGAPPRDLIFCPGCPHRASFWSIHNALELDGRLPTPSRPAGGCLWQQNPRYRHSGCMQGHRRPR